MPAEALPQVRPMLATLGPLPVGAGWGFEFKWDGVRAIVYVEPSGLRVVSRNDRDVTASYPELAAAGAGFGRRRLILDGEIVALDAGGAPSFSLLQQRMHVVAPGNALLSRVPVKLYVFDVLYRGDRALLDMRYAQRRAVLAELPVESERISAPPWWPDASGDDVLTAARGLNLEGVVAKRLDSTYQPGIRSRAWVKTPLNRTVEVVVAGWKPGAGRRAGMIGSLLLGMYDGEDRLVYVGHVGTGFTEAMLADLKRMLTPLRRDTPAFDPPVPRARARGAQWTEPRLVGEVAYRTLTPDHHLRHPAWRGLRPDREPGEVRLSELR